MDNCMPEPCPVLALPPPTRRCEECELHLGRDILLALATCPRWGMPRAGVEVRCAAFVPKEAS